LVSMSMSLLLLLLSTWKLPLHGTFCEGKDATYTYPF
jgi:hypothetical protein